MTDKELIERLSAELGAANKAGDTDLADTLREASPALEASRESACVMLVADIRFACGDNGKRMQPELVEFIRDLAADAARYQWLRDIPSQLRADHDHNPAAGGWDAPVYWQGLSKPGDELQGPDLDAAIDQARCPAAANG